MIPDGAAVTVRDDWPERHGPVHIRTPHYVRGRRGTVVRRLGEFPNPEDLAFARPAARLGLYHVAFRADEIWPGAGPAAPTLLIEIYEPWLTPV